MRTLAHMEGWPKPNGDRRVKEEERLYDGSGPFDGPT